MRLRVLHVTPYSEAAWAYGGIPRVVGSSRRSLISPTRVPGTEIQVFRKQIRRFDCLSQLREVTAKAVRDRKWISPLGFSGAIGMNLRVCQWCVSQIEK
jgi:hypothetical protein